MNADVKLPSTARESFEFLKQLEVAEHLKKHLAGLEKRISFDAKMILATKARIKQVLEFANSPKTTELSRIITRWPLATLSATLERMEKGKAQDVQDLELSKLDLEREEYLLEVARESLVRMSPSDFRICDEYIRQGTKTYLEMVPNGRYGDGSMTMHKVAVEMAAIKRRRRTPVLTSFKEFIAEGEPKQRENTVPLQTGLKGDLVQIRLVPMPSKVPPRQKPETEKKSEVQATGKQSEKRCENPPTSTQGKSENKRRASDNDRHCCESAKKSVAIEVQDVDECNLSDLLNEMIAELGDIREDPSDNLSIEDIFPSIKLLMD